MLDPAKLDVVTALATERSFASRFPATDRPARRLWTLLDARPQTAILHVSAGVEAELCGALAPPQERTQHGVVAEVVKDSGPEGALLLANAAAVREVERTLQRHRTLEEEYTAARFGESSHANPACLETAKDRVWETIVDRAPLDTYFSERWLPRAAIDAGWCKAATETATTTSPQATGLTDPRWS